MDKSQLRESNKVFFKSGLGKYFLERNNANSIREFLKRAKATHGSSFAQLVFPYLSELGYMRITYSVANALIQNDPRLSFTSEILSAEFSGEYGEICTISLKGAQEVQVVLRITKYELDVIYLPHEILDAVRRLSKNKRIGRVVEVDVINDN